MSDPIETAVQKLAIAMKSWKSIELRSHQEVTQHIPIAFAGAQPPYDRFDTHYIETAHDERMLDIVSHAPDGRGRREVGYCDGSRCAAISFTGADLETQSEVRIDRSFKSEGKIGNTERPHNLVYLYVGKVPIYEALPRAAYLGGGRVLGRDVDRFLFPRVRWAMNEQDLVYSLDRETATPLQVESFRSDADRQADRPDWAWSVTRLETVQGHPVALESEHRTWTVARAGSPYKLYRTSKETIESIVFDRDYAPSTFWPKVLGEARVINSITGKVTAPTQSPPANPETKAETAIRVIPETSWVPATSSVVLGLGTAVLIASVVLWWRRR